MTQYANHYGYSDVTPYEVVRVVSDKTLEIRRMAVTRDESVALEFVPGGFTAHCANQNAQRWTISSDPTARVERIRLTKKGWHGAMGSFKVEAEPVKFHDYNF